MNSDEIILGTARWGSFISKKECFEILDDYVAHGFSKIDTASNYPINGRSEDFGLAIDILSEWMRLNVSVQLDVFTKVGSIDNSGSPASDLTRKKINCDVDHCFSKLGWNFSGIGVHWDNRDSSDEDGIIETIDAFRVLKNFGLKIGLSGIASPSIYLTHGSDLENLWEIQVKATPNLEKAGQEIRTHFPKAKYVVYGISGGGRLRELGNSVPQIMLQHDDPHKPEVQESNSKDVTSDYVNKVKNILRISNTHSVIIGPRSKIQMKNFLDQIAITRTDLI